MLLRGKTISYKNKALRERTNVTEKQFNQKKQVFEMVDKINVLQN